MSASTSLHEPDDGSTASTLLLLPDIVLANVLLCSSSGASPTPRTDLRTLCALECSCKRLMRVSASYLIWHDILNCFDFASLLHAPSMVTIAFSWVDDTFHVETDVHAAMHRALAEAGYCRDFTNNSFARQALATGALPAIPDKHVDDDQETTVLGGFERRAHCYAWCGAQPVASLRNAIAQTVVLLAARSLKDNNVAQPWEGFFLGDYGVHGTELLFVERDAYTLTCHKLTGDDNVPGGKRTWIVVMDASMRAGAGWLHLAHPGFDQPWWQGAFVNYHDDSYSVRWRYRTFHCRRTDRFTAFLKYTRKLEQEPDVCCAWKNLPEKARRLFEMIPEQTRQRETEAMRARLQMSSFMQHNH